MPLLTNYHFMKMSIDIDQPSHIEKLATLTQLYLELRLPLQDALRAAEADLSQPEDLGLGTRPALTATITRIEFGLQRNTELVTDLLHYQARRRLEQAIIQNASGPTGFA